MKIHDYCAKYQCYDDNEGWVPKFDVCWCPDEKYISEIDRKNKTIETIPRCCPKTKLAVAEVKNNKFLACPLAKQKKQNKKYCGTGFKEFSHFTYNKGNDTITRKLGSWDTNPESDGLNSTVYEFCVGPTVNFHPGNNIDESIHMKLFQCKKPCQGKHPCLR